MCDPLHPGVPGTRRVQVCSPESVFLDEGKGASEGVTYFAIFFHNFDQWEERISYVVPFH